MNSSRVSEVSTYQGGNFASISVTVGKSDLEQILKQMTFTRSEIQHFISLLHSRSTEEPSSDIVVVERDGPKLSPPPVIRLEASSSILEKHKHGDETDNFHAVFSSRVLIEEQIVLPANAYKGSIIGTGQAPRQEDSKRNATPITSQQQHPSTPTIENLPEELLTNIFIRLLAKQLAQMRAVSKSWNALLSQPSFIKSHLDRSIQNNSNQDQMILLGFYDEESSIDSEQPFTIHTCPTPSHLQLTDFVKLPVNPQFEDANAMWVIGSVNGLICYSYHSSSVIHIWNPSLSAVLTLPPYSTPSDDYDSIENDFRFGFDPKTNDYKVVKLTGIIGLPEDDTIWWLDVEIYSMRKGSWELINERFPSHIIEIEDGDNVCADGHDGHLHWLGYNYSDSERIVAFDLGSETFREIPLPHSVLDNSRDNVLGVLAKKLCVISFDMVDAFEVWVMDEYGVANSWVKRHVFSQFDARCILGFTSHNELLFYDEHHLVLYDPVANKTEIIENALPGSYDKIVEYVDSLVWVTPAKCI